MHFLSPAILMPMYLIISGELREIMKSKEAIFPKHLTRQAGRAFSRLAKSIRI